jgi:23S rRNA (adenine2030-N6)-methyltransferase
MFSYRHAFHAGNHADVLKHTTIIATLKHMLEKDASLTVVDTHAGAGLYRLNEKYAQTSAEAQDGILKLQQANTASLCPALVDYLEAIKAFNATDNACYPGSPLILHHLLREQDRLKLFELHPTDASLLMQNVAHLGAGRQVVAFRESGFDGLKRFLPPTSRRGLVLCDPSYELREDYHLVVDMLTDSLKRFATGTYAIWFPIIARREAQELPRKLKLHTQRAGKECLFASLQVKAFPKSGESSSLASSGMCIVNPPYTLKATLQAALPQMVQYLGQDAQAQWTLG